MGAYGHSAGQVHSQASLPSFGRYCEALVTDDRLGKLHWEFSLCLVVALERCKWAAEHDSEMYCFGSCRLVVVEVFLAVLL